MSGGPSRPGFFIPYRYAGDVAAPSNYAALEPLFAEALPRFRHWLAELARQRDTLFAFKGPPPAPRFDQDWFPRLDAAMAYTLVRTRRPGRIVEIGAGHSTRFLARAAADAGARVRHTVIDPAPRARLEGLAVEHLATTVERVPAELFAGLAPGDVLFVDSSHVLMPGSDVDLLLNGVLPRLAPGVVLHFHDIFLPDGYPAEWLWRGYNEQNALAGWLAGGGASLQWSSHFVAKHLGAEVAAAGLDRLPLIEGAHEASLWLTFGRIPL